LFAAHFVVSPRLQANLKHLFLDIGLSLGLAAVVLAILAVVLPNGGLAYDTRAYWLAAQHLANGTPLYSPATVSDLGAYNYPPIFAQIFMPAGFLPELVVAWTWRISGILCLRYLVGSWRAALVACIFLPVLIELSLGNVTLQLAAVVLFALRDRRGAYLLPWVAALKFGPVLLAPYLWFCMPQTRRPLIIGAFIFGLACLLSYLLSPVAWAGYFATFGWESSSVMNGSGVIALIPAWGGLDFVLRFMLAGLVVLYATYRQKAWLAYAAAVLTCPILAIRRLAPLVGLWRFRSTNTTVLAEVES
jgi:hypothetical protein